jgi:hypothetical protein
MGENTVFRQSHRSAAAASHATQPCWKMSWAVPQQAQARQAEWGRGSWKPIAEREISLSQIVGTAVWDGCEHVRFVRYCGVAGQWTEKPPGALPPQGQRAENTGSSVAKSPYGKLRYLSRQTQPTLLLAACYYVTMLLLALRGDLGSQIWNTANTQSSGLGLQQVSRGQVLHMRSSDLTHGGFTPPRSPIGFGCC